MILPRWQFEDLEDLNRPVLQWCRKTNSKVHSFTGRVPLQELAGESLLVLPKQIICDRYRGEDRKVNRESLVSFDGIRYGVPWQYSGKKVQVRLHNGYVEIYKCESFLPVMKSNTEGRQFSGLRDSVGAE